MTFIVVLERVADAKRVEIAPNEPWEDEDDRTEWYWTEGNMCCDCNRRDLFYRAMGEPTPECADPCGSSEFRLVEFRLSDGRVIAGEKP